jgi:hypothetical protein
MRLSFVMIGVCLLIAHPVYADVYIKAKTAIGDTETWISGKKQRVEVNVPETGKMTTITRADKGVEWQIDMQHGMYEETPIGGPAAPEEPPAQQETDSMKADFKDIPTPQAPGHMGTLETLPEKKEFLGAPATGYRWVPDDSGGVFWMLPLKGDFAKAQKETEEYQKAYLDAVYANSPAKEREEMARSMQAMGSPLGKQFAGLSGTPGAPPGLDVGMEMLMGSPDSDQPRRVMAFEMTELSLAPLDGSVFELPQGLRRVKDLGEEQMRLTMGPGYDAMMHPGEVAAQEVQPQEELPQEEPSE